ncbi:MAG: hypothetical protein ACOCWL_00500 [Thermoguttaceae bacterium]
MMTPRTLPHGSCPIVFLALLLAAPASAAAEPLALPGGLLLEAEQFDRRSPDDGSFAEAMTSAHVLGRRALARFFPRDGWCAYRFATEEDGVYHVWLRYASNGDTRMRWAVNPTHPADSDAADGTDLERTGGLDGPSEWQWGRLGEEKLPAGQHELVLHGVPLRLDAVWIGRRNRPPDEEAVRRARLAQTRRHMANPLEPIVPNWLATAEPYRLPEWYDAIRVCVHTRLSLAWRERQPEVFERAGAKFASLGFPEMVRHIKTGAEPAWWPSSVGAVLDDATEVNLAKQIIDEAHAAGLRILVYHRHMEDAHLAEKHPEWTARDEHGEVVIKRGPKICFNTPYAEFVESRLVELARMGADGFYFDEVHMPKPFCRCVNCREKFLALTDMNYPETNDPLDPAYQKAIELNNVTIERVFRRWREAIHGVNPECVLLVGSNTYPTMDDRHTTHRLYRIADSMKTEFSLPARPLQPGRWLFDGEPGVVRPETDAMLALGYAIARDACDGRPPHVWTHGLPNALHARFATAGLIAHGAVANLDHSEGTIPDPELFADAAALGNRLGPAFAGARPLRWAAVHFSEHARDWDMPFREEAWRNVLHPTYGMFTTLLRERLPVTILTDSQLEQGRLEGVSVLLLPAPDRLTEAMQRAVEGFRKRGGTVIGRQPDSQWHAAGEGYRQAAAALQSALAEAAGTAPVQVLGGPEKMHAISYLHADRRGVTVALVNDFSWVFTGRARLRNGEPNPSYQEALRQTGPPPCRNVVVQLRLPVEVESVEDVAGGKVLKPHSEGSRVRVALDEFDCTAVLAIRLAEPLP